MTTVAEMRRISFVLHHNGLGVLVDGEEIPKVYEVQKGDGDFNNIDPFKGFDAKIGFEWVTGKGFLMTLSR